MRNADLVRALNHANLLISRLEKKLARLEKENTYLKEQLRLQKLHRFGKKSEADPPISTKPIESNTLQEAVSPVRAKKTCGRTLDTSLLTRRRVIHDLAEDEKICSCCGRPLHLIGKDTSEQLEIIPARYCVMEHVRMKYGCRRCQQIVMAPKPQAPLPKSLAGASVLTDIIIDKYHYHLPLYRQSKIMAGYHMQIPDNTLSHWVMQSGLGLLPLYDALWQVLLKSLYLQVDETPVKLLQPEKKGYLWSYFTPLLGHGLVVFEMRETREGKNAEERLAPFWGLLQTDGYSGYEKLRKRQGIVGVSCFAHMRRKFKEAIKISGDQEGIAAQMVERMKPLYQLEARMREAKLDYRSRKRLRQKIAFPLLKAIKKWLTGLFPKVLPKSAVGKAIHYALRQWPFLMRYVRHGYAEMDTNLIENKIRQIAVGRKNWLFFAHVESGKIHALFYSLIMSCVLNQLNPRTYMHYILTRIHDLRKKRVDPVSLLPHLISRDVLKKFEEEQMEFAQYMLNTT